MSLRIIALNSSYKPRKVAFNDFPQKSGRSIICFMEAKEKKQRDPDSVALGKAIRRQRQLRGLKLAEPG